jgi:O-antigen/teichoic acid export membrane protein
MINGRSFVKHAAVYGLAGLLVQAGGFVLLPLYTRWLTPADYGVLEALGRIAETVGTCLMFGGVRQALVTFYQQSQDEEERHRVVATTLSLFGTTILVGGGLVVALAGPLSGLLNQFMHTDSSRISAGLFRLAIVATLLEPLTQMPLALIQARVESLRFVTITVTQFLFRIALCIFFVQYMQGGVAGALASSVLIGAVFGVGLCTRELLHTTVWPSLSQFRLMLRFALPFVPGGVCALLLHHGDRFILLRYHGMQDVGIYSLGYKLALAVGMFSLTPLHMVWTAQMYTVAKRDDAAEVFGTVFTRILAAYLLASLGLALFQEEVVRWLGGSAYAAASAVVAPVLLAYLFQSAAMLMDGGLYVQRRTDLKLGITFSSTLVMLVLYALLIPTQGAMGAALATLGGFAFMAVCTWVVTQRVFPVRYEWSRLLTMVTVSIAVWSLSRLLPAAPWTWPVKFVLWLLAPLAAWCLGLLSAQEKEHVRGLTHDLRRHLLVSLAWSRRFRSPGEVSSIKKRGGNGHGDRLSRRHPQAHRRASSGGAGGGDR